MTLPRKGDRVRVIAHGKGASRSLVGNEYALHSDAVGSGTTGKVIFRYVTRSGRVRSSGAVAVEILERAGCDLSTTEGYRQGYEAGLRRAQELAHQRVGAVILQTRDRPERPAPLFDDFDHAIDAEAVKWRT